MMRLGDFIRTNTEPILMQWEIFARTILPAANLDVEALRDHARDILLATVRDMGTAQTDQEQTDKSAGHGVDSAQARQLDSASTHHALSRVEVGFDLMQLVSEYRALRASVIRLWQNSMPDPNVHDLRDLTRFNESMDQSLAQAVKGYTERVEEARNTFLAILNHDLRTPLAAIHMGAKAVQTQCKEPGLVTVAGSMLHSATAMNGLIEDLLQFAATALGSRIELARKDMDLLPLCSEVADELRAGQPDCVVELHAQGPSTGCWDSGRLREVLSNLLSNAVKHGGEACRVRVALSGDADQVHLSVHNDGEPIAPELLPLIFKPMVRGPGTARHDASGLGLGLTIVERIVSAHGGGVEVRSTVEQGTTFTVRLPRRVP